MSDDQRQIGTVQVESGTVAIVDPYVLAAALDIGVIEVEGALEHLTAEGRAYSAQTQFGDGMLPVFEIETPLIDADPATVALWEPEYPGRSLIAVSWSVQLGSSIRYRNDRY